MEANPQQTLEKVERIKEAIKEIENIKNKEKYSIDLVYDQEKNKYNIIIYNSMNKEIYEKELNEEEYNKVLIELEETYIKNYENEIKKILDKLKENIIREYDLSIITDYKSILKYNVEYIQAKIMIYLSCDLIKETIKDALLSKYLQNTKYNYLYLELEPFIFNKEFKFSGIYAIIYYVSEEVANNIIKCFSK